MKKYRLIACVICALLLCTGAFGADILGEADELQIFADDTQFDTNSGLCRVSGNVKLVYGKLTLTSNEATINRETMDFSASGKVVIVSEDGGRWESPSVSGNLDTRDLKFGPYRLDSPVWYSAGEGGASEDGNSMRLNHVWVSTCELHEPHYRLSASSVKYGEDHTFTAKHVVLRFWKVPVFYFPYLWGNTDGMSGFIIRPGYSGKRGAYLRLGRLWRRSSLGEARVYVDLMSKRGVGLGAENEYKGSTKEFNTKLYGLLDQDPPETEHGYNRRFRSVDERYRINFYLRDDFSDEIALRANLDVLSDIDMLEDWFRGYYRRNNQPKSFLDLNFNDDVLDAGITLRPRVNDFYTVVESLPEYHLNLARTGIGESPFQYQTSNRFGYYTLKWRKFDRTRREMLQQYYDDLADIPGNPNDYESWRFHSQHFMYLPLQFEDIAVLTPRAGLAATYYSRSSSRKVTRDNLADLFDVDNPDRPYSRAAAVNYDANGGEVMRLAYEIGGELHTSFYSDVWNRDVDKLDIHGIQHVLEPYVNYTYMPKPSHNRDYIYYFDEIDRLERQHFIRLGLDQRLLTTRDSAKDTFIRLQTYVDFHFDRDDDTGRHPGDLGARIDFSPVRAINYWAAIVHDIGDGDIQRAETGIRFGREEELNFSVRYIYRNEHISRSAYSLGSTLVDLAGESGYLKKRFESTDIITGEIEIPLNSITSLAVNAEYDFEKSRLSEHRYEFRRRLHCWDMALGVGWDNNDFEMMIMFQLVAFPKIKMDLSM